MTEPDRVQSLQGIHNFRDFGGYRAAGGTIRRGHLWRSGQHGDATEDDLDRIAALGLATVFDLRSSREREIHPCRRPQDFGARVVHADDPDRSKMAPHLAVVRSRTPGTAQDMRNSMVRTYETIAFRPELVAMIHEQIKALASREGPSLVNCMAGKDRTGMAVAVIHLALGVHRDDVIADYLLTNTAGDAEARVRAGADTLKAIRGDLPDDVVRVIMGVEAEYMATALAAIDAAHGSFDAYLEHVVGIDPGLREDLRAELLV